MNTCPLPQKSKRRVISITSVRTFRPPHWHSVLALIQNQRAINLAQVAQSIRADRDLCDSVARAVCEEFGWPRLKVEDAIVLLGRKRLCALLSVEIQRARPATALSHTIHSNGTIHSTNLCLLETFKGEPK
jgi:hypothetical protein